MKTGSTGVPAFAGNDKHPAARMREGVVPAKAGTQQTQPVMIDEDREYWISRIRGE